MNWISRGARENGQGILPRCSVPDPSSWTHHKTCSNSGPPRAADGPRGPSSKATVERSWTAWVQIPGTADGLVALHQPKGLQAPQPA